MQLNSQKGQSLIEAMVALMTILLVITAIAIVTVSGLYNSQFVKNQNETNKLAQQGMEFVKNIQANDLKTFAAFGQNITYCIDEANSTLTVVNCSLSAINTGKYYNRTVIFSPGLSECGGSSEEMVTVVVSWSSSKCKSPFCHKSELKTCMTYGTSSDQL